MKRLKIAIVHHHLRGGGVTRIIQRTLEALHDFEVDVCILTGEESNDDQVFEDSKKGVIKGLSYGKENPEISAAELVVRLKSKAQLLLNDQPDVWHIHNHTLGKNASYTQMSVKLSEAGEKVFFHLHDFSEDNRPSNYKYILASKNENGRSVTETMYPVAEHIRYGVLNDKDLSILKKTGLDKEYLELLSNPVVVDDQSVSQPKKEAKYPDSIDQLYVYPVRVIPRKNIGELVLWATLGKKGDHFATTLAPKNPKYLEDYKDWVSFVEERNLQVTFEAGEKWDMEFEKLLTRSDGIITTSIAEGFGLVYLESWLMGKPLFGRLLPEINTDFESKGIEFPGMYKTLNIPVEWLDTEALEKILEQGISRLLESYGKESDSDRIKEWIELITTNGCIDFGRLNVNLQKEVIDKLLRKPKLKEHFGPLNNGSVEKDVIAKNNQKVTENYSLAEYGAKLMSIYSELSDSVPGKVRYLDSTNVLDQFLSPKHFSLLRN
ncbi:MAG: hypothetical protein BalsKO_27140 [Balneolaceae bacterium]